MEEKIYIVVKAWKGVIAEVMVFREAVPAGDCYEKLRGSDPETEVCLYSWPLDNRCPEAVLEFA